MYQCRVFAYHMKSMIGGLFNTGDKSGFSTQVLSRQGARCTDSHDVPSTSVTPCTGVELQTALDSIRLVWSVSNMS